MNAANSRHSRHSQARALSRQPKEAQLAQAKRSRISRAVQAYLYGMVAGLGAGFAGLPAHANPSGASVVSGSAQFSAPNAQTLNITNTPGTIINWQQFSIGQNEVTRFIQQNANSAVLNRVTSGSPSEILGQLLSNGRVFVINPNGVVFGQGAVVDTAGMIASTLQISDQDFLNGNYRFSGSGGVINNQGIIRAGEDGNVILVASKIENGGVIEVQEGGNIVLAAGQSLSLLSWDNPTVSYEVQAPENEVVNIGQVLANGGAARIFASTIRHSGEVRADGVRIGADGAIEIFATEQLDLSAGSVTSASGAAGGSVVIESAGETRVAGDVLASGTTGSGGQIHILGDQVTLAAGASVDASGATDGGEVLVGGDFQGQGEVRNASNTRFEQGASIAADAGANGDGGRVIVWADERTDAAGTISARGGESSGDGGFVEVSGKQVLHFDARVDTSASNGLLGTLLLDPTSACVTDQADCDTNAAGLVGPGPGSSVITNTSIESTASNTNFVIVVDGDLEFEVPITMLNPAGIDAKASGSIQIFHQISTSGATLSFSAADISAGTVGSPSTTGILVEGLLVSGVSLGTPGAVVLNSNEATGLNQIDAGITTTNLTLSGKNFQIGANSTANLSADNVTIQADSLAIDTSRGKISAFDSLRIETHTSNLDIAIGTTGSGLSIDGNELKRVQLGFNAGDADLIIGNSFTGNVVVGGSGLNDASDGTATFFSGFFPKSVTIEGASAQLDGAIDIDASSAPSVSVTAFNGDINVNNALNVGNTGNVSLTAASGSILDGDNALITAGTLNAGAETSIELDTNAGGTGTTEGHQVDNISLVTSGSGAQFIDYVTQQTVEIGAGGVTSDSTATSSISISGASANCGTGLGCDITLSGPVGLVNGFVLLDTAGPGSINGAGSISASNIFLNTGTVAGGYGSIGTAAQSLMIDGNAATVDIGSAGGLVSGVFLGHSGATGLAISSLHIASPVHIEAASDLLIGSSVVADSGADDFTLVSGGGDISIADGASIQASSGTLSLDALGADKGIVIGAGSTGATVGGQSVVLKADNVAINANSSVGTGATQTVRFETASFDRNIALSSTDVANTLSVDIAEIGRVFASNSVEFDGGNAHTGTLTLDQAYGVAAFGAAPSGLAFRAGSVNLNADIDFSTVVGGNLEVEAFDFAGTGIQLGGDQNFGNTAGTAVTLASATSVSQSAGKRIIAHELDVTADSGVSLVGLNDVTKLAITNNNTGNIDFQQNSPNQLELGISGAAPVGIVNRSGGSTAITSTAAVTQTAGTNIDVGAGSFEAITKNNAGAAISLNEVGNLAAAVILDVADSTGASAANANISAEFASDIDLALRTAGKADLTVLGAVTQGTGATEAVIADEFALNTATNFGSDITLTNTNNDVNKLALASFDAGGSAGSVASGNLAFTDADDVQIGSTTIAGVGLITQGNVSLIAGSLSQLSGALISANELNVSSVTGALLNQADNLVNAFAASNTTSGDIKFRSGGAVFLGINSATTKGISNNGGTVEIESLDAVDQTFGTIIDVGSTGTLDVITKNDSGNGSIDLASEGNIAGTVILDVADSTGVNAGAAQIHGEFTGDTQLALRTDGVADVNIRGAVTQGAGATEAIDVGELNLTTQTVGGASILLNNIFNDVDLITLGVLDSTASGLTNAAISFVDVNGFSIGSTTVPGGIGAGISTLGNVALTAGLSAQGNVDQQAGFGVTANQLGVNMRSDSNFDLTGSPNDNNVAALNVQVSDSGAGGQFDFSSNGTDSLVVSGITYSGGSAFGGIDLSHAGNIKIDSALNGAISLASGDATITSAKSIRDNDSDAVTTNPNIRLDNGVLRLDAGISIGQNPTTTGSNGALDTEVATITRAVSGSGGATRIRNIGALDVSSANAGDFVSDSKIVLVSVGASSNVTVNAQLDAVSSVKLKADRVSVNAPVNAGHRVRFVPVTSNRDFSLGSAEAGAAGSSVHITQADINNLFTPEIDIQPGDTDTQLIGSVNVTGGGLNLGAANLVVESVGDLNFDQGASQVGIATTGSAALDFGSGAVNAQTADGVEIQADNLSILSANGVGSVAAPLRTAVNTLGDVSATSSGDIVIANTGGMTVDATATVDAANGRVALITASPLTIDGAVSAENDIALVAGNGGLLTIAGTATVDSNSGGVDLQGGDIDVFGLVTTKDVTNGVIRVGGDAGTTPINVGAIGTGLSLDTVELANLQAAAGLEIGDVADPDGQTAAITINAAIDETVIQAPKLSLGGNDIRIEAPIDFSNAVAAPVLDIVTGSTGQTTFTASVHTGSEAFEISTGSQLFSGVLSLASNSGSVPPISLSNVQLDSNANVSLGSDAVFNFLQLPDGSLSVDPGQQLQIGALSQSGGLLGGDGLVELQGPSTWTGGTWHGSGTTVVQNTLGISGPDAKQIDARAVQANGDVTFNGGSIATANGASWTQSGGSTFNWIGDLAWQDDGNGGAVNLIGDLIVSGLTGMSMHSPGIAALVRLQGGTLDVGSSGARFDLAAVEQTDGVLTGGNAVGVLGDYEFHGGSIKGGGELVLNAGMRITGSNAKTIESRQILVGSAPTTATPPFNDTPDPTKQILVSGDGDITMQDGAQIGIGTEASLKFTGGANVNDGGVGAAAVINVAGVLEKDGPSTPTGNTEIGVIANLFGAVEGTAGELTFSGGGDTFGTVTAQSGAEIEFADFAPASRIFGNGLTFQGAGHTLLVGESTIENGSTVTVANGHTQFWDSAQIDDDGTLNNAGTIFFVGDNRFSNGTIENQATGQMTIGGLIDPIDLIPLGKDGSLEVAHLNNAGQITLTNGDTAAQNATLTVANNTLTNLSGGQIRAEAGTANGSRKILGRVINQSGGTIEAVDTDLVLDGNGSTGSTNDGTIIANGGDIEITNSVTFIQNNGGQIQINPTRTFDVNVGTFDWVGGDVIGGGRFDDVTTPNTQAGVGVQLTGNGSRQLNALAESLDPIVLAAGSIDLIGGQLDLKNGFTVAAGANAKLTDGVLNVTGNMDVDGTVEWEGGSLGGVGDINVQNGGQFIVTLNGGKTLDGKSVSVSGMSGGGDKSSFFMLGNATAGQRDDFTLANGAGVSIGNDGLMAAGQGVRFAAGSGSNNGIAVATGGQFNAGQGGATTISADLAFDVELENLGTVLVDEGGLIANGGVVGSAGGNQGVFDIDGAGRLEFAAGTNTGLGIGMLDGTLVISGGTNTFSNALQNDGTLEISGGVNNFAALTNNSQTTVSGGDSTLASLDNVLNLNLQGTATRVDVTGALINRGATNVSGIGVEGDFGSIDNRGTLALSSGTTRVSGDVDNSSLLSVVGAAIASITGTLTNNVDSSVSITGGTVGIGNLNNSGQLAVSGGTNTLGGQFANSSDGTATFTGGTNQITGDASNAGNVFVQQTSGLQFLGDYTQTAGLTQLGAAGTAGAPNTQGVMSVEGTFGINGGRLTGNGQINGNVVNNGTVAPGFSPGELRIAGTFTQGAVGLLQLDVNGIGAGEFDQLIVDGAANLDGTLEVAAADTSVFGSGANLTLLSADSVSGSFATQTGPDGVNLQLGANGLTLAEPTNDAVDDVVNEIVSATQTTTDTNTGTTDTSTGTTDTSTGGSDTGDTNTGTDTGTDTSTTGTDSTTGADETGSGTDETGSGGGSDEPAGDSKPDAQDDKPADPDADKKPAEPAEDEPKPSEDEPKEPGDEPNEEPGEEPGEDKKTEDEPSDPDEKKDEPTEPDEKKAAEDEPDEAGDDQPKDDPKDEPKEDEPKDEPKEDDKPKSEKEKAEEIKKQESDDSGADADDSEVDEPLEGGKQC